MGGGACVGKNLRSDFLAGLFYLTAMEKIAILEQYSHLSEREMYAIPGLVSMFSRL
jgi:hypothetical protein